MPDEVHKAHLTNPGECACKYRQIGWCVFYGDIPVSRPQVTDAIAKEYFCSKSQKQWYELENGGYKLRPVFVEVENGK